MEFAEPVTNERVRPARPRREAPPSDVAAILAMQHGAGNQAVARKLARTLTIKAVDLDSAEPTDAVPTVETLKRCPQGKAFATKLTSDQDKRWNRLGDQDAPDMAGLADKIIAFLEPDGPKRKALMTHKPLLENALAEATPRHKNITEQHESEFMALIFKCDEGRRSRSKGTASVIANNMVPAGVLPGVAAFHAQLVARNAQLGLPATYTSAAKNTSGMIASLGMDGRSGHENRVGWLPVQPPAPAPFDNVATQWLHGVDANHPAASAAVRQAIGAGIPQNPARTIEESTVPTPVRRRYYSDVFANAATGDLVRNAWWTYTATSGPGCRYVEFIAHGTGRINRFVWDFMSDRLYMCMHYNMVKGYNPFIEVTGLGATY